MTIISPDFEQAYAPVDGIPIGDPFPRRVFESLGPSYVLLERNPPVGPNLPALIEEYNGQHPGSDLTLETLVHKSNVLWPGTARLQAVRHIGDPFHKLTGLEPYFIGHQLFDADENNPTAIALSICLEGLALRQDNPSLASDLLSRHQDSLPLWRLSEIDRTLGNVIQQHVDGMTPAASQFRTETYSAVDGIPYILRRSFYRVENGALIQTIVVPRLRMHPALESPGDVFEFAQQIGLPQTREELQEGRLIMKSLSQSGNQLLRYLTGDPDSLAFTYPR